MKTITFCNHKGGVGKTAVSMAFAEDLNSRGYRTLIVDLDQQGNATSQARIVPEDDAVTVYDLLMTNDYSAKDAVKHYEHGDIIPGDDLVMQAESELTKLDTPLTMLADNLVDVRDDYDYCIIDCPPSLGYVTRNAIVAADEVLVVALPEHASVTGFTKVVERVSTIKANRRLNPDVRIVGVLVNTYDPRGRLDRSLDDQLPEVAAAAGTKVFDTKIRKCVSVRQAQTAHVSLFDYDPGCTASKDLQAFVDEYLAGEEVRNGQVA